MKLNNIHGFKNLEAYIKYKIARFAAEEKSFECLFQMMFDEHENIMIETSDGYRVNKITYGQCKEKILSIVPTVKDALADVEQGQMVGLHMANCVEWLELFWAILICGYRPLIMNTRLSNAVLNQILQEYGVNCVISDGEQFAVKTVTKEAVCIPSDRTVEQVPFGTEVIFMSSGSTDNVKLCAYTGENFYHQICASVQIVEQCPHIQRHYEGELKQLMLLPLCHVFGFIAVYLWFGFFSRTFVFPKDLNPTTIQRTVKKHNVTHIFAVPMVWESVHKAAVSKIKARGDKTYAKFCRASAMVNRLGGVGDRLAKRMLREVREGLFGDSVQFMITGGSAISTSTLAFFNGIGYHLTNGYGMTEIGITSLELSSSKKTLNTGSIGVPLGSTEYQIDDSGKLLVRGKTCAVRILQGGEEKPSGYGQWFQTGDLMQCNGGRYYSMGRSDDLIIGSDGENLNPQLAEAALLVAGMDRVCVFSNKNGAPVVLASVPGCFDSKKLGEIYGCLTQRLAAAKLESAVSGIYFTHESLLLPGEFKLSRKKLAARFQNNEIKYFEPMRIKEHIAALEEGLETEIRNCFAQVLNKDAEEIGLDDNFFLDLQGTSMDYFVLLSTIKSRIGVELSYTDGVRLTSVGQIAAYIKNRQ